MTLRNGNLFYLISLTLFRRCPFIFVITANAARHWFLFTMASVFNFWFLWHSKRLAENGESTWN